MPDGSFDGMTVMLGCVTIHRHPSLCSGEAVPKRFLEVIPDQRLSA